MPKAKSHRLQWHHSYTADQVRALVKMVAVQSNRNRSLCTYGFLPSVSRICIQRLKTLQVVFSTDWSNLENTWAKCSPPPAASCSMSSWAMTLWPFACENTVSTVRPCWSDLLPKVVLEFPHPIWNPIYNTSCTRSQPLHQRDKPSIASCHCAPTWSSSNHFPSWWCN